VAEREEIRACWVHLDFCALESLDTPAGHRHRNARAHALRARLLVGVMIRSGELGPAPSPQSDFYQDTVDFVQKGETDRALTKR
jgi:hypothetical protein